MKSIIKEWWLYIAFSLLVMLAIYYKSVLAELTEIQGIEIELLGALVIFLMIDIPLKLQVKRKEKRNTIKTQFILDSNLFDLKVDVLMLMFDYIYLPSLDTLPSKIQVKDVENELKKYDLIRVFSLYFKTPYVDKLRISTKNDQNVVIHDRDLRSGYTNTFYYQELDKFYNTSESKLFSMEDILERSINITSTLEKFLSVYSVTLS